MTKSSLALLISILGLCSFAQANGRLVCEAVSKAEAQKFAASSHFMGNFDVLNAPEGQEPPYVEPKGTLSCAVPVSVQPVENSLGEAASEITVLQSDASAKCQVTYFDGTPARSFPAVGSGHGYANLLPNLVGVSASFTDTTSSAIEDDISAADVSDKPQVLWSSEWTGSDYPEVPLVSKCHVEL